MFYLNVLNNGYDTQPFSQLNIFAAGRELHAGH